MRLGWILVFAFVFAAGACGGSSPQSVPTVAYQGALPASVAARYLFNVLTVNASANGAKGRPVLVDTGSPMTGVDPSSWTDAKVPADVSVLASLAVGPLRFTQVPTVPLTECGASCSPFDVTGLVGGNVLRSFAVAFDYRAPAVTFGRAAVPASAQATPVVLPFTVAGGGSGTIAGGNRQILDVPPTRIVLHPTIEGTARALVLDTGASYTLLRESVFAKVVADGRAQLTLSAATATGATQGAVARSREVAIGGATSTGSPIASVPDAQVDDVAAETGETIDGMLGGSFLRGFYAVVNYPGKLSLYPYAAPDPLADEFDRVGVFLIESDGGYDVVQAIDPAANGLVGAVLNDRGRRSGRGARSRAGRSAPPRGQPGTTHTLHLGNPGGLAAVTLTVKDMLALAP